MLNPLPQERWTRRTATHLLNRAGFGGPPAEREALYQLGAREGVAAAVDSLVAPEEDWSAFPIPDYVMDEPVSTDTGRTATSVELAGWFTRQMRHAQPLAAKLFKFLVDHFPIDIETIRDEAYSVYLFKHFDLLRKHARGAPADDDMVALTRGVSWSGAMIRMLDLQRSSKGAVNENFGRELMELFTLGVDGGYTEQDVAAVAAAFTGRRINYDQFPYEPYLDDNARTLSSGAANWDYIDENGDKREFRRIDTSEKAFLGATLRGHHLTADGDQGDQAIDVIFANIQCAHHTCWKLWRYFVAPGPEEALLQELAVRFKNNYNYAFRPLLRDIFLSEEFYAAGNIGRQVKDPVDLMVSTARLLEAEVPPKATSFIVLERLGLNLTFPPSIQGWPEPDGVGNQWLATGTMMWRLNTPAVVTHGDYEVLEENYVIRTLFEEDDQQVQVDWDKVAPKSLRSPANFNLLIRDLGHRLLPLHRLRTTQLRGLYQHYTATRDTGGEEDALRELLRLLLSLPEFQMQ